MKPDPSAMFSGVIAGCVIALLAFGMFPNEQFIAACVMGVLVGFLSFVQGIFHGTK